MLPESIVTASYPRLSRWPTLSDLPDLSPALVDALDALFPEKCPDIQDTERAIWMYAGKRELVRALRIMLKRQQEQARNL